MVDDALRILRTSLPHGPSPGQPVKMTTLASPTQPVRTGELNSASFAPRGENICKIYLDKVVKLKVTSGAASDDWVAPTTCCRGRVATGGLLDPGDFYSHGLAQFVMPCRTPAPLAGLAHQSGANRILMHVDQLLFGFSTAAKVEAVVPGLPHRRFHDMLVAIYLLSLRDPDNKLSGPPKGRWRVSVR